jgi:NTP pyrophosphatase (non-canonical NTP hydrolase)
MSYGEVEIKVVQWGEARGIVQNATAMSQAIKTLEETTELLDAINKNNIAEIKDAVGDIVVTLIMVCAVLDIDLVQCLKGAYAEIKDRKGYLTKEGVFVKEV